MKNLYLKSVFVLVVNYITALNSFSQSSISNDINAWAKDIEIIKNELKQVTPNFLSHPNSKIILSQLDKLGKIKNIERNDSMVFELQRILNLIGDDGSNIIPFQSNLNLEVLPIKAYWFKDGLFIFDAKDKSIVNQQILEINHVKVESLFKNIQPYIDADNIYYQQKRFPIYAFIPRLLKHIGAANSIDHINLKLASGKLKKVNPESVLEYVKLNKMSKLPLMTLGIETSSRNYSKAKIKEDHALYIQLKKIEDDKNVESFKSFISEIKTDINDTLIHKVILDLRFGGSGNGFKLMPLVKLLKTSNKINQKGNLLILIGGNTTGPLVELASMLEQNTKAILIGEPTGEGPNSVSDTKFIKLKNTGLGISLTKKYWPTTWSFDQRNSIKEEISVDFFAEDYHSNHDPWLQTALNFKHKEEKQNISELISDQLIGRYKIGKENIIIQKVDDKVILSKPNQMASFFSINTELYFVKDGLLATDIYDVFIEYKKDSNQKVYLTYLNWKEGYKIPID